MHAVRANDAVDDDVPAVTGGRMTDAGGVRPIVARAPTRLDFGGGWTDVPPYSVELGGTVCCIAIARHATVRLYEGTRPVGTPTAEPAPIARAALRRARRDDLTVALESDFPTGAGLGGSSAVGVALAAALAELVGERPERAELAERSRAVEVEELGVPGGRQDHYAAAFGGALELRFGPGERTAVGRLPLAPGTVSAIERRCIVAYTGEARVSGRTITAVLDAYRANDRRVCDALARMAELSTAMAGALREGRLDDLGRMVGEHWRWQRSLHPAIPTPAIDRLLERAARAGALGGKALGASGGGCILAIAPDDRVDAVRAALGADAALLPFRVDLEGVRVQVGEVAA
jgi:D-glycero-alpha-D-manno-heptose-7-phosphate kinase